MIAILLVWVSCFDFYLSPTALLKFSSLPPILFSWRKAFLAQPFSQSRKSRGTYPI